MRFSSRVDVGDLNAIARLEQTLSASGVELTSLNDSNPTSHGLAPAALPGRYRAEPRGPIAVRKSLAGLSSLRKSGATALRSLGDANGAEGMSAVAPVTDPERLYVVSSTSQAYSWLMKLLCDPGDVVLAPTPGYPLIVSLARLEAVRVAPYPLRHDGSWGIDIPAIEDTLSGELGSRIRALVLINPNNPTGSYVKPGERDRLVELCAAHALPIIADEVFFDFPIEPFAGNRRLAGESGVLTFALDGFSKMLAAPHAKLGWIEVSGPDDDVVAAQRHLDVIADDYLPVGDLVSDDVDDLLAEAPQQNQRVLDRITGNLRTLHQLLEDDGSGVVSVLRAEGGWNVLLRLPQVVDEDVLISQLMRQHHLTGQPGYFFDMPSSGYLALSLLPEPTQFRDQVRALLAVIHTLLE